MQVNRDRNGLWKEVTLSYRVKARLASHLIKLHLSIAPPPLLPVGVWGPSDGLGHTCAARARQRPRCGSAWADTAHCGARGRRWTVRLDEGLLWILWRLQRQRWLGCEMWNTLQILYYNWFPTMPVECGPDRLEEAWTLLRGGWCSTSLSMPQSVSHYYGICSTLPLSRLSTVIGSLERDIFAVVIFDFCNQRRDVTIIGLWRLKSRSRIRIR